MKRIAACARFIACAALLGALTISSPAAASPPQGRVIYSADFSSPVPGWYQTKWSEFEDGAYVIHAPSIGLNLIGNHPRFVRPRATITLRASLNMNASAQSGFGIYCLADYKNAGFQISYLVHRDEEWTIYEGKGSAAQKLLAWGSDPNLDVVHQTSVTAVCDALPHTIKFGLYLDGHLVSSQTVPRPKIVNPWYIGINVYRANSTSAVVSAKSFVLRNP
jgi:hypothetical protein